jgi:hypothetical protein
LDDDDAGRRAIDDAKAAGAIDDTEYHVSTCRGYANAELEDLVDPSVYASAVTTRFGVLLGGKCLSGAKSQWSDRVKKCFRTQGKLWNSTVEKQVKWVVANEISQAGLKSLNPHHRAVIDILAATVQERLSVLIGPSLFALYRTTQGLTLQVAGRHSRKRHPGCIQSISKSPNQFEPVAPESAPQTVFPLNPPRTRTP